MPKLINMTGWKMSEHGVKDSKITIIKRAEDGISPCGHSFVQWLCQCECGSEPFVAAGFALKNGNTLSCGCFHKEQIANCNKKMKKKFNDYDLSGEFGVGYTTNGEQFWFDLEDYDKIKNYCWLYNKSGYLAALIPSTDKQIAFHRLIMNAKEDDMVDHITHPPRREYKIDNRKSNLRIVTSSQNQMNRCLSINNKSGVTGVWWSECEQKWKAYITVNYKQINLGTFDNKEEAIQARALAENKYFGEYKYNSNEGEVE